MTQQPAIKTHRTIPTDAESYLSGVIGADATATLESDPRFIQADPGAHGSSENIAVQRDTDDTQDSPEETEETAVDHDAALDEVDEQQEDADVQREAAANR